MSIVCVKMILAGGGGCLCRVIQSSAVVCPVCSLQQGLGAAVCITLAYRVTSLSTQPRQNPASAWERQ